MSKCTFGIIGCGWRADFFLRVAHVCRDRFEVLGMTSRDAARREKLTNYWRVPAFATGTELIQQTQPDFVVTSVPAAANPSVIREAVELGIPVLSETPPAPDIEGLISLNELTRQGAKIQVAEQLHRQPYHAARLEAVRRGLIGSASQAQVSVAHGYHGISLMRRWLGIAYEPAKVSGFEFTSPIVRSGNREGPADTQDMVQSNQQFLRFDFGDKLGIYDFSPDQYFSLIRNQRVLVRGERGEIVNDEITYLKDATTPIRLRFERHTAGVGGNLEGNFLKGIQLGDEWVYTNPFAPATLSDDEIAVASCLAGMASYVAGGDDFYSLAEGSQDQYLALLCARMLDEGRCVSGERMPWAT